MTVPNPIIPSEPMRYALKTTCKRCNGTWLVINMAGEPDDCPVCQGPSAATPAPEPQPEVAAEPVAWRWRFEDQETWTVQKNKPHWYTPDQSDIIMEPLYPHPPSVAEEAVKAERCDGQLCYYHGCQRLPGCVQVDALNPLMGR